MTNPFRRGSAPGREQPDYLRTGSFKPGHKKTGGRKRGTPNAFSADYKKAILEAAYRVGNDGNGKDGVLGYFCWIAARHKQAFGLLLPSLLRMELAEGYAPEQPRRTINEIDQSFRHHIGLTGKDRTKGQTVQFESRCPWSWTDQDFPVGSLMHLAVEEPREFCQLLVAAFLRPTKKRRGFAARSFGGA